MSALNPQQTVPEHIDGDLPEHWGEQIRKMVKLSAEKIAGIVVSQSGCTRSSS